MPENDQVQRNAVLTSAEAFLERQAGLPFCAHCLAYKAELPQPETRAAIRRLESPRFVREERLCARCMRETLVVYAAYPELSLPGR